MNLFRALGFLLAAMIFLNLAGGRFMPQLLNSIAQTGGVFFRGTRRMWGSV